MNTTIPDSTPLAMMTAGQLRDLINEEWNRHIQTMRQQEKQKAEAQQAEKRPHYIFGLKAMADYLGMSLKTFQRNRQRGMFDGVVHQMGRQFRALDTELDAAFDRHNN